MLKFVNRYIDVDLFPFGVYERARDRKGLWFNGLLDFFKMKHNLWLCLCKINWNFLQKNCFSPLPLPSDPERKK